VALQVVAKFLCMNYVSHLQDQNILNIFRLVSKGAKSIFCVLRDINKIFSYRRETALQGAL